MDTAPTAPGKLGTPVEVQEALTYLGLLGAWIQQRRTELDELDATILASPDRALDRERDGRERQGSGTYDDAHPTRGVH